MTSLVLVLLASERAESAPPFIIAGTQITVDFLILGADEPAPSSCALETATNNIASGSIIGGFVEDKVTRLSAYCAGNNAIIFQGATIYFQQCTELPGSFRACWSTTSDVEMALQYPTDGGWVGFAFTDGGSTPMIGSHAIIGSQDSLTPTNRFIGEVVLTTKDDGSNGITLDASSSLQLTQSDVDNSQGTTTVLFRRASAFLAQSMDVNIAFATGGAPMYRSGQSPLFRKHSDKHYGSLNFQTGVFTEVSLDSYRSIHAILMTVAWAFMLPCGIIAARFFKSDDEAATPWWFHAHRAFQVSGLLIATAGFAIALFVIGTRTYMTHRTLGIIVMSFGYFQPFNAVIRPEWKPGPPTTKRKIWEFIHKTNGRVTVICALVNIYFGLSILNPGVMYVVLISILISLWGTAAIGLEIRSRCRRSHTPEAKTPPLMSGETELETPRTKAI